MEKGNTLWLIDAAYLFNAQRSIRPDYNFDYLKLRRYLEEDGSIHRAYYLNSTVSSASDEQTHFHAWLKTGKPYGPQLIVRLYQIKDVRFKCPECRGEAVHQMQKGVDVGIATLILRLAYQKNYDTLILSSGDGDLLDAISHVKEYLNKRIELCVFKSGVSPDLQAYADHIYWMDDFSNEIEKWNSNYRGNNGE